MYQIASKGYNLVRTKFDRNRIKFIIKRPKAKKIIRHISGRAGTPVRLDKEGSRMEGTLDFDCFNLGGSF